MDQVFERPQLIEPSLADASGRLGVHDAFALFMDLASEHAAMLGSGVNDMARRGLFWLTVKTHITFFERPRLMERVSARTWPEAPGKVRCNRSYQLRRGDQVLLAGKTEWAVIGMETKQLTPLEGIYPDELGFDEPSAYPGPFARILDGGEGWEGFAAYRVRSTDIDLGGHMNNAAYVRALLGAFSTEALHAMPIGKMDVVFRSPCYEGDQLEFQKRAAETGLDLRILKDGATALLARIEA
jgi:acyl-ACP thioesterase